MSVKTTTAYRFNGQGYFDSTFLVQFDNISNTYLMPSDATLVAPEIRSDAWCKWNGSAWEYEYFPTTAQEAFERGYTWISNGPEKHNQQVKSIVEALVEADKEHYKVTVDDSFHASIEVIPEPTFEEKKAKKLEELKNYASQFDSYKCKEMWIISSVGGYKLDADIRSQTNVEGLIRMLGEGEHTLYKDYDDTFRDLTRENLETIDLEFKQNGAALYQQKFATEAAINAASTEEELNAIQIQFTMRDFS